MASCSILTGGGASSSVIAAPSVFTGEDGITTGNLTILGSAGAGVARLTLSQNTSGGSGVPTSFEFFTSDDSGAGYLANALQLYMYTAAGGIFNVFNISQDGTAARPATMTMAGSLLLGNFGALTTASTPVNTFQCGTIVSTAITFVISNPLFTAATVLLFQPTAITGTITAVYLPTWAFSATSGVGSTPGITISMPTGVGGFSGVFAVLKY